MQEHEISFAVTGVVAAHNSSIDGLIHDAKGAMSVNLLPKLRGKVFG
jgi:hypothetical protein